MTTLDHPGPPTLGDALVADNIGHSLRRLWEGDLRADDLIAAEFGIRAHLTARRVFVSVPDSVFGPDYFPRPKGFGPALPRDLSRDLLPIIAAELKSHALLLADGESPPSMVLATDRLKKRMLGDSSARTLELDDDMPVTFQRDVLISDDYLARIANSILSTEVQDIINLSASSVSVFAESSASRICDRFLMEVWPKRLFESTEKSFQAHERALGRGLALRLPCMVSLLLSRSTCRADIPVALADLRTEYKSAREDLWKLLRKMLSAKSYSEQAELLRTLRDAADAMYEAAYGDGIDVLSLMSGAATMSLPTVAGTLRKYDAANARVSAVLFTRKLSADFRRNLCARDAILKRHFSASELRLLQLGA